MGVGAGHGSARDVFGFLDRKSRCSEWKIGRC